MNKLNVGDKGLEEVSKLEDGQEPSAGPDIFEKLFGKKPEVGYEFTRLSFSIAHRAICFEWSCKGVGFGEYALIFDPEKGFDVDTECMSHEFSLALFAEAIKRIDAGQKATRWKKLSYFHRKWYEFKHLVLKKTDYPECMGYKTVDSTEDREEFIKNVILTFKYYLVQNENIGELSGKPN